jgi:hypothetical protein
VGHLSLWDWGLRVRKTPPVGSVSEIETSAVMIRLIRRATNASVIFSPVMWRRDYELTSVAQTECRLPVKS